MKQFFLIIMDCLMLSSCSDGYMEPNHYTIDEVYGYYKFSTAICLENSTHDNLLDALLDEKMIKVECIRESDSARMTLSDYQLYSIPVVDNLLNLPSPIIYLSWMDMDAQTSHKEYDVNYILRIHCTSLWEEKTHDVVWHMHTYDKKLYPIDCTYGNQTLDVQYISLLSQWTALVRVTLQ